MKRIVIISLIVVALVGACTATLLFNKKKIDEKMKLDGNLKAIPVFVTEIRKVNVSGNFEVNGTFQAIHELTLMSEGQGKVEELLFHTGQVVSAGQVLAVLDDDLLRSQLSLAEAALEKSANDLKKYEDLLKDDAISSQQFEDAKLGLKKAETDVTTLRKQVGYASIASPIAGTITKRFIEKGSLVMPGTPVAEIVDISRLKFIANVAESEAVRVGTGQGAEIGSSLFPGITYRGTVVSVGVKADDARRFPVEIEIFNDPRHPLKAGMFGTARFKTSSNRETLMIPRQAIVGSIKDPRVYVADGDIARLREIRIGSATDREVEVLGGLAEGDRVIVSGQINLDDNAKISIVTNK
jgi:RND family efflux transporter MFP subunit